MYILQPTFPIFAAVLANALPQHPSPSLTQRDPTDLENTETLELDVRNILMDSSPPTGKVTLSKAHAKWNKDDEWLVYDVEGLGENVTATATATTREDGKQIDPESIDDDALLGYGHDMKKGIHNQRWWMLESKEPSDITGVKELDIKLNTDLLGEMSSVLAVSISDEDDIDEGDLFFSIPEWIDKNNACAVTRVTGGRMDPETVQRFQLKGKMLLYGYEDKDAYRRRWWLVYKCE